MSVKLYESGLTSGQIIDIMYRITEIRSEDPIQYYSCFISYSHSDKTFARRLHDEIQKRGIRCWMDEYQVRPGRIYVLGEG